MDQKYENRLLKEKSPYLLQHANNPVDWYPWGAEAFAKAKSENKPVFLSIGYSTCHWCHIMAHESFEDLEVAGLLNDAFISVKVDREERPDIDSVYMAVCQIMTGSGGWPLTIIMTPDKRPFFAATYIPKETRFGRTGLLELMPRVKKLWDTQREEVLSSASQIAGIMKQTTLLSPGEEPGENMLELAYGELKSRFDTEYGGFGTAPKFPIPHNLLFLLRYWKRSKKSEALEMVEKTLDALRDGGIYDQLGFGFHRYSTDRVWLVPHFEKMLYDQALLATAYLEAYQATGKAKYAETARQIFSYVLRDMKAPEGGFYSAEDADSEGEEGKFYLWTHQDIRQILVPDDADLFVRTFNIEKNGNFTDEAEGKQDGRNIPHLTRPLDQTALELNMTVRELQECLEPIRLNLFARREERVHPHKDDKILTDWNGLMVAALARGGSILEEPLYTRAAERAVDFIFSKMVTPSGRLYHRYRSGEAAIGAYLDDYAFLIHGLLELYETTFKIGYLRKALDVNQRLIDHFWDKANGGFYLTADDSEELLLRSKDIYDGAIPSGNSMAMLNLLRLGRITANVELEAMAARIGSIFSSSVLQQPSAFTQFLIALDFALGLSYEIVITGELERNDTREMLRGISSKYIPNKVVIFLPAQTGSPEINQLIPFTENMTSLGSKATAYVCLNYQCKLPTTSIEEALRLLDSGH